MKTTKTTPPPATLFEAALRNEHERHASRLATLKRMQARLALLDAYMPALKAAGLHPLLGEINDWSGKDIYLRTTYFTAPEETQRLLDTLLAQGMKEIERRHYGPTDTVTVAKGRLQLVISVDLPRRVWPAQPATAAAAA